MLTRAVFDQRQIRLAERFAKLGFDSPDQLGLRQRTSEPAKFALEMPELVKFLTERHCDL
jgi:hypothetical protein